MGKRDRLRVCDWHKHIAIFKTDNQQILTIEHRELYSAFCINLMEKELEKEYIHVYVKSK